MNFKRALSVLVSLVVFLTAACAPFAGKNASGPGASPVGQAPHVRKLQTPAFGGDGGAIIFVVYRIGDPRLSDTLEKIVRVFAANGVPLDVAIQPTSQIDSALIKSLTDFADAGIIDVSVDGYGFDWLDVDTPNLQNAYSDLKARLSLARQLLNYDFGTMPAACLFPYEALNEHNYSCVQGAGFQILSTQNPQKFESSREPVNWAGIEDTAGLSRLPIVGNVNYPAAANSSIVNQQLLDSIGGSARGVGAAVVQLDPALFVGDDEKTDAAKLQSLGDLVKSSKGLGQVVTFDGWNRYAANYITPYPPRTRIMPVYRGGSAVIFRLDDVCKNWHEDTDQAIVKVFRDNDVPIDLGIISNAAGAESYKIPWVQAYVDNGSAGISVHGFDWNYYQIDTSKSGFTFDYIKQKLVKARDEYLHYFGVSPVACTIPTDFFDENGYRAVDEAGFRIFATQIEIEPHPAADEPVNFQGRPDPDGMYRIPTATDVSTWDSKNQIFGDPVDVSQLAANPDFCKYFAALSTTKTYNDFGYRLCQVLGRLNVAAVSMHPTAFLDANGKPDAAKLQKLDAIVKWVKSFATITTFEAWCNYQTDKVKR